jgi:hypothetical protein
MYNLLVGPVCKGRPRSLRSEVSSTKALLARDRSHTGQPLPCKTASAGPEKPGASRSTLHGRRQREMPAEGEPIGSCGGAPGNEPAYPRPGAPAHETGPILSTEVFTTNTTAMQTADSLTSPWHYFSLVLWPKHWLVKELLRCKSSPPIKWTQEMRIG